jgi:ATP-binding cassette subfamily F protein 3
MNPAARIRAEEQALISGLQNVPKPERHRLKEISTEAAYEDWQLSLLLKPMELAGQQLEAHLAQFDPLLEWMDPAQATLWQEQSDLLLNSYTECCMNWYEKWLEFTD